MFTSLTALVFTVQAASLGADISWSQDYAQAQKQSAAESKPMAVIVGTGNQGYSQLVRDGGLSKEATDLLFTNYVCVYVDAASPQGKQLVGAFELTGNTGVVLSDRSGVYQRFWHDGTLSNRELVSNLTRCATVSTTSSYRSTGASEYQPGSSVVQPASSYCPSCQGGVRYRR